MKKLLLALLMIVFFVSQSFAWVWVDYQGVKNTDVTKRTSLGHFYSGLYKWNVGGMYIERYCQDVLNDAMDYNAIIGIPSLTNQIGKYWNDEYSLGLSASTILEKYTMVGYLWQNIHPG